MCTGIAYLICKIKLYRCHLRQLIEKSSATQSHSAHRLWMNEGMSYVNQEKAFDRVARYNMSEILAALWTLFTSDQLMQKSVWKKKSVYS